MLSTICLLLVFILLCYDILHCVSAGDDVFCRCSVMVPRLYSNGDHCVTFNYHMYGFHVNELRLARKTSWGQLETVWRQRKDHGDRWLSARVDVIMGSYDKVSSLKLPRH